MNIDSFKDSTALTNTITYPFTLTHETSGTEANGIGVGLEFTQQTTGGNEIGATIEAVTLDVTSTSEDFSLIFNTMAAGAAAAERMEISSTAIEFSTAVDFATCTIADGDATPDVTGCTVLTTSANTGATAITDLDSPVVGAIYYIIGGSATNSSTIADSGNFALSAAFTATVDEVLVLFVQADNDYVELSRSTN